jgi:hypothetical protein
MSYDVFSLSVADPRQRWKLVLPLFTNNNNSNNNLCCQLTILTLEGVDRSSQTPSRIDQLLPDLEKYSAAHDEKEKNVPFAKRPADHHPIQNMTIVLRTYI